MFRVMIVIDSERVDGAAKGLLDFCDGARERFEPLIAVFERGRRQSSDFREACSRRGLTVGVLRERCRFDPSPLIQARRLARSFRPDLVEANGYKANVVALALRGWLGVPWVAMSHGVTNEGPKVRLYWRLDRLIVRRADLIVAVSEARAAALDAAGCPPESIATVHNAIEVSAVGPVDTSAVRRSLGLHADGPVVAVIGRLSPEKGHGYFVEAMAEVARAVPAVQGLIVGDGQEEQRLRAKVRAMDLGALIHFAGYRRDVDRIYPAIDLLVVPSLSEGLPMVVLEAMGHGRPVVGTCVGGVPEALEDNVTGLLVPPADVGALARAIGGLLLDPVLCQAMGKAGQERVERRFSVRARAERVLSLYGAVVQRSRAASSGAA